MSGTTEPRCVEIEGSGAWFAVDGGRRTELLGRSVLRRLLAALADAATRGEVLPSERLVAAGWPDERIADGSAKNRLYFAINELRRLGLRDVLVHQGGGYVLDARVQRHTGAEHVQKLIRGPIDRFVGRTDTLAAIRRALVDHRVVTLTGIGGIGKSRVALEVVRTLPGGADRVVLVDLAHARTAADVAEAVVAALGCHPRDAAATLAQTDLVVLDEVEGVADGASQWIGAWSPTVPSLRVLVTSRVPLNVRGERLLVVPELSVDDAAALFHDRAGLLGLSFDDNEVRSLVVALDGSPLAIELAAARSRVMPPRDLYNALPRRFQLLAAGRSDAPERHQSLAQAVRGTWEACSEDARAAWSAFTVFRSGCTEASLAAVLEPETPASAFDALDALVRHNVLTVDLDASPVRFRMPTTLRAYAAEQLDATVRARLAERHLAYFERYGRVDAGALPSLVPAASREIDELWAAHDVAVERGDVARAARCLVAAFVQHHNHAGGGARVAERGRSLLASPALTGALRQQVRIAVGATLHRHLELEDAATAFGAVLDDLGTDGPDRALEALAAERLAEVNAALGRIEASRAYTERALAAARAGGDEGRAALAEEQLARMDLFDGDPVRARLRLEAVVARLSTVPRLRYLAVDMQETLGVVYDYLDLNERSEAAYREVLATLRADGGRRAEARVLGKLAALRAKVGDHAQALTLLDEVGAIHREIGVPVTWAMGLATRGLVLAELERWEEAEGAVREAIALLRDRRPRSEGVARANLGEVLARQGKLDEAADEVDRGDALLQSVNARLERVQSLAQCGLVRCARGEFRRAREALDAAEAILAPGFPPPARVLELQARLSPTELKKGAV